MAKISNSLLLQGGTVIIRLGPDPVNDILLLPRDALEAQILYFASTLSGRWGEKRVAANRNTDLWQFAPRYDHIDNFWSLTLQASEINLRSAQLYTDHYQPSNSTNENAYKTNVWCHHKLPTIIRVLMRTYRSFPPPTRVFIHLPNCLGVGSASSPHLIKLLCPQDPIVSDECTNGNLILCVANVAAYADYYRCLPMIANLLRANLLNRASDINLLKDAAYEPAFHLGLAVALRFVALFEEALKHYARRSLYYLQDALNNNPYHQDDSYYSQSLFVRNDIVKGQSVPLHEDVLPAQVVPLAQEKPRDAVPH